MFDGGGNGSDEVIACLDKIVAAGGVAKRPDVTLFAISDGDQLLNYLGNKGFVSPVQGPTSLIRVASQVREGNFQNAEKLRRFLFEQKTDDASLQCLNGASTAAGEIKGKLVMANSHCRRSDYSPLIDADYGSVLLLEASHQALRDNTAEGLQFVLGEMERRGQHPKAIVLSESDFVSKTSEQLAEIQAVAASSTIPIFRGGPFGHARGAELAPLPLHTNVDIRVSGEFASMKVDVCRTPENFAEVAARCEARAPYLAPEAVISKLEELGVVKIEGVRVAYSRGLDLAESKEGSKSESWVSRVGGSRAAGSIPKQVLLCQNVNVACRCEAPDLDGVDLKGKNVAIDFRVEAPSFDVWKDKVRFPFVEATEENYQNFCTAIFCQSAQTTMLELDTVS